VTVSTVPVQMKSKISMQVSTFYKLAYEIAQAIPDIDEGDHPKIGGAHILEAYSHFYEGLAYTF
jgi:hypothetical protein